MEFNEADLWAINELKDFLPKKIFDSHAHFYDSVFCPNISGRKENGCYNRKKLTQNNYNAEQSKFYGENVQVRTNMIVAPFDKVMSLDNEYRLMSTDYYVGSLIYTRKILAKY